MSALEVRNLRVAYGDVVAVWEVDLVAAAGEVTAILGRNGAGKSTLLKGMAGVLPTSQGSVKLGGLDLTQSRPWVRSRAGLGFVPEGKRVFRELTVAENLEIAVPKGAGRGEAREMVDSIYEEFPRLADYRSKSAAELSGGQQQLLALGQALVPQPKVLMVDEPSSGLAPMVFDEILRAVVKLKSRGVAVVLVEQLVEEVLADGVADRVLVLERGRVALHGRASEITADDVIGHILSGASH